jgi:acyl-coenzyme A thioesterase PaaI-like protein
MSELLTARSSSRHFMLDLSLVYHRPATLGRDRDLHLTASIGRRGRRITTVDASILSSTGRVLTIARGTFKT